MRPRKRATTGAGDLFRARLDQIINLKHELAQLADAIDWDWIDDKGTTSIKRGDGESTSIQWGAEVGYRFNLGRHVSLTPALNVGSWLGADTKCNQTSLATTVPCDKESQLGFYGAVSVALGIAF